MQVNGKRKSILWERSGNDLAGEYGGGQSQETLFPFLFFFNESQRRFSVCHVERTFFKTCLK